VVVCGIAADRARRSTRRQRVRRRVDRPERVAKVLRVPGTPRWLPAALADAEVGLPADRAWALWVAGAVAVACAGAALGGPVLAFGGAVVGAAGPFIVLRARRGTAATTAETALPGALEAV